MRVLFLSDLETAGGASIAASRLANGLASEGVEVLRYFGITNSQIPAESVTWQGRYVGLPRGIEVGISGLKRLAPALAGVVSRPLARVILLEALRESRFDILHVHALQNSNWNHATLAALDPDLPTVWTFHDCWGFSPESHLYRDMEGAMVRLKPDGRDRARAQRGRLDYFRSRRRLRLVANSRATSTKAEEHLAIPTEVIHCGLPLELYRPLDPSAARDLLGLPRDALVLGFSADSTSDQVKGYKVLQEALRQLDRPDVWALAMGLSRVGDQTRGGVTIRSLGRVDNPRLQAIVYSACDAFVMPSLAEALGQVAMEAIACGTPVVGSNVGGIPEVVLPGESGWLFPAGDAEALARQFRWLASHREEARRLSGTCRGLAERQWGLKRQAESYLKVYRELIPGL
jgi:glycosyltransferase involved in cell wall biosynthesis